MQHQVFTTGQNSHWRALDILSKNNWSHIGIKVTNVEPGPFRTDWAGRSASYLETKIEDCSDTVGTVLDWIKGASGNQAGDPYKAGQAIYEITTVENPPLLLPLG